MLDLNFVRDNLPLVEEKLRQRGINPAELLKDFTAIDAERRQAITAAETLQARRNRASEEIAKLKKTGQDASAQINETKELREQIQDSEKKAAEQEVRLRELLTAIPNLPHASVPAGKSADDNVEARRWGTPPKFDFTPKPHWELGEELGILDLERAAKLTGARFAVYWALGARLERALANFMLDLHTKEQGYTEVLPPFLVNSESMYGTGQLPKFAQDLFRVPHGDKDLWLIPTAEVPVTNLYRDEILDGARLPTRDQRLRHRESVDQAQAPTAHVERRAFFPDLQLGMELRRERRIVVMRFAGGHDPIDLVRGDAGSSQSIPRGRRA